MRTSGPKLASSPATPNTSRRARIPAYVHHCPRGGKSPITTSATSAVARELIPGSTQRNHRSCSSSVSRSDRSSRSPEAKVRHRRKSQRPIDATSHLRQRVTARNPSRCALSRSLNRIGERRNAKSSITMSTPATARRPGRVALTTNSATAPTKSPTEVNDARRPERRARSNAPRGGWERPSQRSRRRRSSFTRGFRCARGCRAGAACRRSPQ